MKDFTVIMQILYSVNQNYITAVADKMHAKYIFI
jgi:hypothetical protein